MCRQTLNVPIRSERIVIRQFERGDIEAFVSFMTDSDSTKFLVFDDEQKSREGATALLDATIKSYNSKTPMMAFAVEALATHEFLGFCGLTPRGEGSVEIMYAVMPNARGKGYATEIAATLAQHATCRLGYRRVVAPIAENHKISQTVATKAGFEDCGLTQHPNTSERIHLFVFEVGKSATQHS